MISNNNSLAWTTAFHYPIRFQVCPCVRPSIGQSVLHHSYINCTFIKRRYIWTWLVGGSVDVSRSYFPPLFILTWLGTATTKTTCHWKRSKWGNLFVTFLVWLKFCGFCANLAKEKTKRLSSNTSHRINTNRYSISSSNSRTKSMSNCDRKSRRRQHSQLAKRTDNIVNNYEVFRTTNSKWVDERWA